jgi:hypothetical protein
MNPLGKVFADQAKYAIKATKAAFGIKSPSTIGKYIGQMFAYGIMYGFGGLVPRLIKTVMDWANKMISQIKSLLNIRSPSGVGREIGAYFMQGITEGVQDAGDRTVEAVRDRSQKMVEAVKEGVEGANAAAKALSMDLPEQASDRAREARAAALAAMEARREHRRQAEVWGQQVRAGTIPNAGLATRTATTPTATVARSEHHEKKTIEVKVSGEIKGASSADMRQIESALAAVVKESLS